MSGRTSIRRPRPLTLLGALAVTPLTLAVGGEPPPAEPQSSFQACASIVDNAARLACYDRLTGAARSPAPAAKAPASAPTAAAPPANTGAAPAATSASAAASAPATAAAAPAAPAAPAPPKESFGLYTAEHPKPQVATSLEARVLAVGKTAGGHMTVSLEGGAVWELDEADALLAAGDTVSITRAAFGSYIMHTPTQRTHRVHRLQ